MESCSTLNLPMLCPYNYVKLKISLLKLLRPDEADCPRIGQIRAKILKSDEYKKKTQESQVIFCICDIIVHQNCLLFQTKVTFTILTFTSFFKLVPQNILFWQIPRKTNTNRINSFLYFKYATCDYETIFERIEIITSYLTIILF